MKLKNGHAKRAIEDAQRCIRHLEKLIDLPSFPGIPADEQAYVRYRLNAIANGMLDLTLRLSEILRRGSR